MTQIDPQSEIERLEARIVSLEEKSLRVSNIYRYENFQNLLKAGKWLEADKETVELILAIAWDSAKVVTGLNAGSLIILMPH